MKFSAVLALAFVTVVAAAPTQRSIFTDPYTIHPDGDKTKCVGVLGGKFVVNATIDIFDCNGSATQKWFDSEIRMTNPEDGSEWALDVPGSLGAADFHLENGSKVVLRPSADGGEDGSPTQAWRGGPGLSGAPAIKLGVSTTNDWCLDLTDGNKENRTPLQLWACIQGNTNQKWSFDFEV
ncbi:ricin B lectin domain-containing protein [Mycena olivaceomarginata]|nr:ricin B lectin domain-containing protein [Mycena olivaceomarginata]